ncbi:MAG TPA: response regulator [Nitrospirae bacterium]|nr:response regulator [Nitrospirota bacterium]
MAKILVVDDELGIRVSLWRALEFSGHKVTLAKDGEEGDRLFRENPTDLVITDLVMPKKEGLEFMSGLLVDFPDLKILVISGGGVKASSKDIELLLDTAQTRGAVKTFAKPFELHEILACVRDLLAADAD